MFRCVLCLTLLLMAPAPLWAGPPDVTFWKGEDGMLLEQQLYRFAEDDYDRWIAGIGKELPHPAAAQIVSESYSRDLFERHRKNERVEGYRIVYSSGGLRIAGYLVKPKQPVGRLPVIIFNHGGVMQWGHINSYEVLEMYRLAERGYAVLASHFRGEGGSQGQPEMGGGDVADALNLIALARRQEWADANRVGMWGFSRGGGVTYQALANTDAIRAAVIIGGPVDAIGSHRRAEFEEFVYPHVLRNYEHDKERALERISPIRWVESLSERTAILMLHGGADWRVLADNSLRMAGELQRLQRPYALKTYEGGSHNLLENFTEVRREMDRWFDRYVRDGSIPPSNAPQPLKNLK
jgi:dipeptidyl aminopeptidase/acylaminoacyl peptidase